MPPPCTTTTSKKRTKENPFYNTSTLTVRKFLKRKLTLLSCWFKNPCPQKLAQQRKIWRCVRTSNRGWPLDMYIHVGTLAIGWICRLYFGQTIPVPAPPLLTLFSNFVLFILLLSVFPFIPFSHFYTFHIAFRHPGYFPFYTLWWIQYIFLARPLKLSTQKLSREGFPSEQVAKCIHVLRQMQSLAGVKKIWKRDNKEENLKENGGKLPNGKWGKTVKAEWSKCPLGQP